ncbi:MAG: hypothetical protein JW737_10210 [Acidobacteria bacterium]|nr:hypothetical protein [Acidobacteriota bacterium]
MNHKQLEKLIADDKHGIYSKPSGDLVVLPIRRHHDWLAKEMELIGEGSRIDDKEIKKQVLEQKKEKEKKAKKLIKKYGEEILEDLPHLFQGVNLQSISKDTK